METNYIKSDQLIFSPGDVDLSHSPLANALEGETYVLGAFNPGLCRLANGNLLLMIRVAEALKNPVNNGFVHSIRWDTTSGYLKDKWRLSEVEMTDPRKFRLKNYSFPVYGLTSLSWLLPVELNRDGSRIEIVHYDKIISPAFQSQEYGIEDPRISYIDGAYCMTVCCVSSRRHSTMLYLSEDGLNYKSQGIILDHQNKDMLIFEGKIRDKYYALTRPLGECYFATPPDSSYHPGPSIQTASSPDMLHWKPSDKFFLGARRSSPANEKVGGGSPPLLTPSGWLMLYHGVTYNGQVGVYCTYWALLDKENPEEIIYLSDQEPLLQANPSLTKNIADKIYLNDVVFTTGIVIHEGDFIIASGELDLACRITRISQEKFIPSPKANLWLK